jgi:hypothetical protein
MLHFIRYVFIFAVLLLAGVSVAFGIAWLVGLVLPWAKIPIFFGISLWWLWTGWRYAKWRDRNELNR